jgi:branched-chain amino acid aminotransferase
MIVERMGIKAVWMDGELVGHGEATVPVGSLGLHYGLGFFEGIRCYDTAAGPAIFRLDDHLRRLVNSAAIYGVTLPYTLTELAEACKDVVRANALANCYVRPIAFMGESRNGDPLGGDFRVAVLVTPQPPLVGTKDPRGATAKISSFRRITSDMIPPAAKATGQYLNSFLAQEEARRCGAEHAICLAADGRVADAWAHNIFTVRNGVLTTPPLSAGILPGITRDSVLTLAREAGHRVLEADMVRTDLYLADECMLTGTGAGIVPVISIDGRRIGDGASCPVSTWVAGLLSDVAHGRTPTHAQWRQLVGLSRNAGVRWHWCAGFHRWPACTSTWA